MRRMVRCLRPLAGILALMAALSGCSPGGATPTPVAPSGTAAPSGPGAAVAAMFIDPPAKYQRVRDNPARGTGYLGFDLVAAHQPQDKPALLRDGFQFTYARAWSQSHIAIILEISIAEYRDAAAANDIQTLVSGEDLKDSAADGTLTPLPQSAMPPGATGFVETSKTANDVYYLITFSKGRYHVNVSIDAPHTPATIDDDPATLTALVEQLAQQQAAKISA